MGIVKDIADMVLPIVIAFIGPIMGFILGKKNRLSESKEEISKKSLELYYKMAHTVKENETIDNKIDKLYELFFCSKNDSKNDLYVDPEVYSRINNLFIIKDSKSIDSEKQINKLLKKKFGTLVDIINRQYNHFRKILGYPYDSITSFFVMRFGYVMTAFFYCIAFLILLIWIVTYYIVYFSGFEMEARFIMIVPALVLLIIGLITVWLSKHCKRFGLYWILRHKNKTTKSDQK